MTNDQLIPRSATEEHLPPGYLGSFEDPPADPTKGSSNYVPRGHESAGGTSVGRGRARLMRVDLPRTQDPEKRKHPQVAIPASATVGHTAKAREIRVTALNHPAWVLSERAHARTWRGSGKFGGRSSIVDHILQ